MKTLKEYIDSGELDGKIITLNVLDKDNQIYLSKTIMFATFEEDKIREDLFIINENIGGNIIFISKNILANYFLDRQQDDIHYVFNVLIEGDNK